MTSVSSSYAAGSSAKNKPSLSDLWPEYIDARFERAVDIVQSLPRSGPIQTSYDDKLNLYSVYKQATEGDIRGSRPGLLDVLGRAKWDAWNKRRGMSEDEAKHAYVEHLIKILRGYSDKPQAKQLLRELENFTLDPPSSSGPPPPPVEDVEDEEPEPRRRRRERAPVPPSLSVAPSLPGYGPPRTTTDPIREPGSSESSDDDAQSSAYTEAAAPVPSTSSRPPYPPQLSASQYPASLPFPPPPASIHSFRSPASPAVQRHTFSPPGPMVGTMQQQYTSFRPPSLAPPASIVQQQPSSNAPAITEMAATLDKIQTSLTALHERLSSLETGAVPTAISSSTHQDSAMTLIKDIFVRLLIRFNVIHPANAISSQSKLSLWARFIRLIKGSIERALKDVVVIVTIATLLGRWNREDWSSLYNLVLQSAARRRRQAVTAAAAGGGDAPPTS